MGKPNFSEDFKRDAVHQITVRGYPVREVSERLGVSTYSLYKWMKLYAKAASQAPSADHEAESRFSSHPDGLPRLYRISENSVRDYEESRPFLHTTHASQLQSHGHPNPVQSGGPHR